MYVFFFSFLLHIVVYFCSRLLLHSFCFWLPLIWSTHQVLVWLYSNSQQLTPTMGKSIQIIEKAPWVSSGILNILPEATILGCGNSKGSDKSKYKCFKCNNIGHFKKDCPEWGGEGGNDDSVKFAAASENY